MSPKHLLALPLRHTLLVSALYITGHGSSVAAQDAYERYVRGSEDFRAVKQEKAWALRAWPSWTFMPWTHQ